ncbi:L-serine ammonia-lyase, iron-sulfur-dependent, subunit alpha [Paenibacillus sp. N1-5-1-14]|uniref:L-serine ammonia-lyase, iron-sulfur-dependent, subunit alpha n=1 Tax=Paenibacillus radicibacter TaxID=2972488 RepID=UPI002159B0A5|nr:L-serine ammonia-lyase, iron-sulfur-dependent, subunit alpha [Paenibacillus radicibacter]MCR8643985.1 L-serine ammonia-lyase, iron-sulfur-dependent, subunit alpha [Paenibacillus radicibacter]
MFRHAAELVQIAEERSCSIADVMIEQEMHVTGRTREQVVELMGRNLDVMEAAVKRGLEGVKSHSGLTGGDAVKLHQYINSGQGISDYTILDAVSKAVATNEVNAAMGLICATPTAGSAGVVPGVLFAVRDKLDPTREQMIEYLFTAGAFGMVVANNASISGAAGGCQAEVGSAAGMAAAAVVALAGGTPQQSATAMAIALKNLLGLVCDPVAGLVEVPCVKRNAMGAAVAMVGADMALAGITSTIPCDEVIEAMFRIGQSMPASLRETALGGLAATPTGKRLQEQIFGKVERV